MWCAYHLTQSALKHLKGTQAAHLFFLNLANTVQWTLMLIIILPFFQCKVNETESQPYLPAGGKEGQPGGPLFITP